MGNRDVVSLMCPVGGRGCLTRQRSNLAQMPFHARHVKGWKRTGQ